MASIGVTGGAGYIGSHLVDRLVSDGYAVTVLDSLEPQVHRTGTWPSYANARARYVRGDVRDRAVFEPLVLAADAVVHFGAAVSVGQSMYQVDRYVDVNTRGNRAAPRHPGERKARRPEGTRRLLDRRLRRRGVHLRGLRAGGARHPVGGTAGRARLGAALSPLRAPRRLDSHARGQGALPRQHLFDDQVPPGRDGAAHRQDLRHSRGRAALLQRLRAAAEPQQPVCGRRRHLAQPPAERQGSRSSSKTAGSCAISSRFTMSSTVSC